METKTCTNNPEWVKELMSIRSKTEKNKEGSSPPNAPPSQNEKDNSG
jgi:hypothetical protein